MLSHLTSDFKETIPEIIQSQLTWAAVGLRMESECEAAPKLPPDCFCLSRYPTPPLDKAPSPQ